MSLSLRVLACSFCAVALLLTTPLAAQEELVDSDLGFTLKIPEGFKPNAEIAQANPKIAHAFHFEHPEDETENIILIIEKMRGTIGRERLDASILPTGINAKLFVTQWQGFEVDGVELLEETEELKLTTYNVQIPLQPFAIQIKLCCQPQNKPEMDRVLRFVLNNLQGQTNWQTPALTGTGPATTGPVPAAKPAPGSSYERIKLPLTLGIVTVVGGLIGLYRISKRTPPGTILALAAIIWCVGWGLGSAETRIGLIMSGCLKVLGVTGFVLGIADLLQGRKPPPELPPLPPMAEFAPPADSPR